MRIFRLLSKPRKGRLYIPAITIVMVVVTLVLMHGVSTVRTLGRERRNWENLLQKNARDIISMVKAEMRAEDSKGPLPPEGLRQLLDRIVESLDLAYLGLLGEDGEWIAGTRLSQAPPFSLPEQHNRDRNGRERLYWKIKELPNGRKVFEFAEYVPIGNVRAAVVGLWMTPFEETRARDIRHALMMGMILLVLGSGAFYFIFVVQNYYLVNRTLAEMRSYTENVVESMANGLITLDTSGRVVSMNRAVSDILGLEGDQILGCPLDTVIPPERLDVSAVLQEEKPILEKEIDCPAGDGTIPLSVSATPLRGPEGVQMGAVIILRDLREIRELQDKVRRSERLASLGRLASGVAHEIRNPLSSIKGFAQYFRDKFKGQSPDESYADIMIEEVDRLNRVITELLDFARPRPTRRRPLPVSEILEHSLRLIQPDMDRRGIKLIKPPFPKNRVDVDADQIGQALLNTYINAMESMENGGELRVEAVSQPKGTRVEIRISDTGTGIRREDLPRIFDPFFSTKKKGTGLGLAITAKIIEAHQGEISAESEEGKGTMFKIHLPAYVGGEGYEERGDERENLGG